MLRGPSMLKLANSIYLENRNSQDAMFYGHLSSLPSLFPSALYAGSYRH